MNNFKLVLSILLLVACSSKKDSHVQSSDSCMEIIKNTKIKAPANIKYFGIYSNTQTLKAPDINRYTVRVVYDGRDCQAIVMDYMDQDRPSFWNFSEKFDCKQKQVLLKNSLAFNRPHKKALPFKRPLTLKAQFVPETGDIMAIAYFAEKNEWNKPESKKLLLIKENEIDEAMAPFDWELIKLMRLQAKCYRENG